MNSSVNRIQLLLERSSPANHSTEPHCMQNSHNLMVCRGRCFSPMVDDLGSPGISPIFGPNDLENFKFSKLPEKAATETNKNNASKVSPNVLQQQQQQKSSDLQVSTNGNASFELDLSTSTKLENSIENSFPTETINNSNVLNRTMDVSALLKSIGLGAYSEKFAKADIDLEKFLKFETKDLKHLGFQSDDDCNAIIEMLKAFE